MTTHEQERQNVAGYYADGTEADLGSEMRGSGSLKSVAYDSLDDRLYLLSSDRGLSTIDIYEANGVQPEVSHWHVDLAT